MLGSWDVALKNVKIYTTKKYIANLVAINSGDWQNITLYVSLVS